jgi:hypothetical protein
MFSQSHPNCRTVTAPASIFKQQPLERREKLSTRKLEWKRQRAGPGGLFPVAARKIRAGQNGFPRSPGGAREITNCV